MNARVPASADVLTEVLADVSQRIDAAQTIEQIERECIAGFRVLNFAQAHGLIADPRVGIDAVYGKAEQAKRNMRARIEAARGGMQVAA